MSKYTMNKWLSILIGLILLVLSIYFVGLNVWGMRYAAITIFKGMIVWVIFFIGLLLIILGITDLND